MGIRRGKEHNKVINNAKQKSSSAFVHVTIYSKYKGNFIASHKSDFIKPHVDEIIATEETPDPKGIPTVEKKKDAKSNQNTAKKTDEKAAAAETVP